MPSGLRVGIVLRAVLQLDLDPLRLPVVEPRDHAGALADVGRRDSLAEQRVDERRLAGLHPPRRPPGGTGSRRRCSRLRPARHRRLEDSSAPPTFHQLGGPLDECHWRALRVTLPSSPHAAEGGQRRAPCQMPNGKGCSPLGRSPNSSPWLAASSAAVQVRVAHQRGRPAQRKLVDQVHRTSPDHEHLAGHRRRRVARQPGDDGSDVLGRSSCRSPPRRLATISPSADSVILVRARGAMALTVTPEPLVLTCEDERERRDPALRRQHA